MRVHKGERIEFTYTDNEGTTDHWTGKVTTAAEDKEWFRMATGEPFPRTFRYDRVEGEIHVLSHV